MTKQICAKLGYQFIGGESCSDCVKGIEPKYRSTERPVDRPRDAGEELEELLRSKLHPGGSPILYDGLAEAATRMPSYYRLPDLTHADGDPVDIMDLVELRWPDCDNFCEKDVLKYLFRAGAKPGVPAERDWLKIVRVAARKYRRLSGEDLPADV